jgi:surfeit locus 1 family protein
LIEDLEKKTTQSPVGIPLDIVESLDELEYRRVRLTGSFDHSRELHIWPRTLNKESTQRLRAEPGTQIVTPFFCKELKQWILVNRGWVPKNKTDPTKRPDGQIEGEVTLTAVVRKTEKRPPFSPKNDPASNHWSHRDVDAMAATAGTEPILLDADSTTTVHGGPIGGQTRISLRNDHLQYVFTWYALSLATAYMFYLLWKRKGSGSGPAQKLYQNPPSRRKLE